MQNGEKKFDIIIISILAAVTLAAIASVVWRVYQRQNSEAEFDRLAEQTDVTPDAAAADLTQEPAVTEEPEEIAEPEQRVYPTLSELGIPVPEKKADIAAMQADSNEDIYAWIYIPDTKIDYPVLQNANELDYYLNTNLDGSKGYPGCIYTQMMNAKDWTDKNTVLYGHNMRNGTMFGSLHLYEDSVFFDEHSYVYIYTQEELLAYQVFAAYEYNDQHLLLFHDTSTPENFQEYLDLIFENDGLNNNFDTEVKLDGSDRIITLSTCINNKPDRRWLVQAVLVAEGEGD